MDKHWISRHKQTDSGPNEKSRLLKGLETMRDEIGPLAEELIGLLSEGDAPTPRPARPITGRTGRKH